MNDQEKSTTNSERAYAGETPTEHVFSRELYLLITLGWNSDTRQNAAFYYLSIIIVNCIEYV